MTVGATTCARLTGTAGLLGRVVLKSAKGCHVLPRHSVLRDQSVIPTQTSQSLRRPPTELGEPRAWWVGAGEKATMRPFMVAKIFYQPF